MHPYQFCFYLLVVETKGLNWRALYESAQPLRIAKLARTLDERKPSQTRYICTETKELGLNRATFEVITNAKVVKRRKKKFMYLDRGLDFSDFISHGCKCQHLDQSL